MKERGALVCAAARPLARARRSQRSPLTTAATPTKNRLRSAHGGSSGSGGPDLNLLFRADFERTERQGSAMVLRTSGDKGDKNGHAEIWKLTPSNRLAYTF